jgi:nucleotide-binding universal stress UspA family protein
MSKAKVLIPLDGSNFSRQILPHVTRFFPSQQCELVLVRVTPHPSGNVGLPPRAIEMGVPMYESERDANLAVHPIYASQEIESLMAALQNELRVEAVKLEEAGYRVTSNIRFGDPAQEITAAAAEADADLIAMTTHGRSGLTRVLFGSVAEQVMRNAQIPVMIVRPLEV